MKRVLTTATIATLAALMLTGCGGVTPAATEPASSAPPVAQTTPAVTTPTPTPSPAMDPVAAAITDRFGECLIALGFTKPFTIDVFEAIDQASVSGTPGVVSFLTGTSNDGSILTMPDDSDNSARALASVGC